MIRGAAAVVVLLFHVRYRFFLDFADLRETGPLATAWYVLTAFGHDAVMVFFVVSGLLVGAATIRELRTGRWTWPDYLTARCVRLYVVLIPGLLLTLFWDRLGLWLFGSNAIYTGAAQSYHHDFFNVLERAGTATLLKNAVFLQGIAAPTFGSNDALWSLAFEFWYYIAFPLLAVAALGRRGAAVRAGSFMLAVVVLYAAGTSIVTYFPIWLLGVLVGSLPSSTFVTRRQQPLAWLVAGAFACWMLASHTGTVKQLFGGSLWITDSLTGLAFATWLYVLLHDRRAADEGWYGGTAHRLAGMSYSLYVVHLPLLVFLRAWVVPGEPWTPSLSSIGGGCAIALLALTYAWGVAWLTESRTAAIRRVVDGWRRGRAALAAGQSANAVRIEG